MFLKFESQDERREYGGSCFVEFQFCMMPEGTQQNRIFHSIDHWRDDSLYVHGDSPLFSTYKEILGTGIHPNMTEGILSLLISRVFIVYLPDDFYIPRM